MITGSGVVTAPVAMSYGGTNRGPQLRAAGQGAIVVSHREFVADVFGAVTFNNIAFPINPGLSTTFPWLSALARNFDKYKFRRLKFCYEPSTATVLPGTVMLAIDLDASDPSAISKREFMSFEGASKATIWAACCTQMPEMQPLLYNRVGAQPVGTDIKTYDAGNFEFAVSNCDSSAFIGEVYVEYEVELHVPQSVNLVPLLALAQIATISGTTTTIGNPDTSNGPIANPVQISDVLNVTIGSGGSDVLAVFNVGTTTAFNLLLDQMPNFTVTMLSSRGSAIINLSNVVAQPGYQVLSSAAVVNGVSFVITISEEPRTNTMFIVSIPKVAANELDFAVAAAFPS
jgi:hypothetical protein